MLERDENYNVSLRRGIEARMLARGLNPKSLSLKAGLGSTYIGDFLRGRSKSPISANLAKIAAALACRPEQLLSMGEIASETERDSEVVHDPDELALLRLFRLMPLQMKGALFVLLSANAPDLIKSGDSAKSG